MRTHFDNNILPKQIAFIIFRSAGVYDMTYLSNTYLCAIWHISKFRIQKNPQIPTLNSQREGLRGEEKG